jgi:trehalose-phosphatase
MARQVPSLLGFNPHPEIWGSYGIERLQADGSYVAAHISKDAKDALTEAEVRLDKAGLGRALERKPGAVAAHWRGLNPAQVEEVRTIAYRVLLPLVLRSHLLLAEFDGGLEIREPLCSKGDVVRSVLSEYGADVPVAYLGDDATDEDAFGALLGRGLTVLVRPTYRFTAAQIWIRLPEGLVQFLTDWIRACGGDL